MKKFILFLILILFLFVFFSCDNFENAVVELVITPQQDNEESIDVSESENAFSVKPLKLTSSDFELLIIPGDFMNKQIEFELLNVSNEIVQNGKLDLSSNNTKVEFSRLPDDTPFLLRFKENGKVFFEFPFRTLKKLYKQNSLDLVYFVDLTNKEKGYVEVSIFGDYKGENNLNFDRNNYHLSNEVGLKLVNTINVEFYGYSGKPKFEFQNNYQINLNLNNSEKGYFSINYVCDKSKIYYQGHGVEGHLNERYFMASHEQFLILPNLSSISNIKNIDFSISPIIPSGWKVDTWWEETEFGLLKIPEEKIPKNIYKLSLGALHFYAYNPEYFEVYSRKIGDTNIRVIKEKSIKEPFETATFKIYEKLVEHWGGDVDYRECDYSDYTVMIVDENTQVYAGEYTDAQGFSKVWGIEEMLVHQIYHRWNGWVCKIEVDTKDENYGIYGFWNEGVNEFYCDKVLTELNLTYPNQYMRGWYNYYKNIYGTNKDCPIIYFNENCDNYLRYGKGAVIAYYIDKRLREVTNNKYSMDTVLQYFLKGWKERNMRFSYNEFFDYLEKLGVKQFIKEIKDIFYNNKRIELKEFE